MSILRKPRPFFCVVALLVIALGACDESSNGYISIEWEDLLPDTAGSFDWSKEIFGTDTQEPESESVSTDQESNLFSAVVRDYDGKSVKIPGFLLPLEMRADGANEFLLVPYTGACIHVPPPPPNQIVYVTTEEPYEPMALFEPVFVSGKFRTVAMSTEFADIGYAISADSIDAYEEPSRAKKSGH